MSWDGVETWKDYFPYTPRPIQETMLRIIPRMLEKRNHMIIEAANGTGKTITALAASLPYALRNNLKIIYMARTHSQMDRVISELDEISKIKTVNGIALRGRGSMCINPLVKKHAQDNKAVQEMCMQLKTAKKCEFFNNMQNEKLMLSVIHDLKSKPARADYIFQMAEDNFICPAETARAALPVVNVIACSYLYLFDPDIRASFLENIGSELEDLIVIVDECHNLPDNVQSITSDQVSTFSFNRAVREATSNGKKQFVAFLDTCVEYLLKMNRRASFDKEVYIDPAIFLEEIELELENIALDEEFFQDMIDMGNAIRNRLAKRGKEPRSSLGRIGEFFFRWFSSIGRSEFTHSFEKKKFSGSNDYFVILRLDSLDPSIGILPVLKQVNCSLHISGTIGDPEAYKMMTGLDRLKSMANILPSPYESRNIKALIIKELTTQYRKRSSVMWTKMVHAIAAVAKETPANMGVFVPSYAILRELLNHGLDRWVQKPIIEAESGMSSEENDKMIRQFKRMAERGGAVLCSVLGGRSSEGSDFPGDLMNSVVVVGIPYAPPNVRVDAQITYLNEKFPGRGRLLSYNIPAINRASQAAGRPVRGLTDRAFILMLDYRFGHASVNMHLPEWLRTSMELVDYDPELISAKVQQFFNS